MENYSVLMSVYSKDNPDYLKQSIESMLNQTIPCNQFIIVEDGPINSQVEKVIDDYCKNYSDLFQVIKLQENGGLGHALNIGLKYCKNELVARMDADDISFPNKCEEELACFSKDERLAIVGAQINEFYDDVDNIISSRVVPEYHEDIVKFARRRSPFNHPTVMFKKSIVLECGGYPELNRKEDLGLFPKIVNKHYAYNIPKPLLFYRSDKNNYKRRKTWTNCKEYIEVIYSNYKSGYSSFGDFVYVAVGQMLLFMLPTRMMKKVSDKYLRSEALK